MATHSINKFEYGDNTYLLEDNRISSYNSTGSGLIVDTNGNLKIDPNYLAVSDALIFKGTLGTGGTVTSLPATHSVGDVYKVITEGTYAGHTCEEGDMVICITNGTTNNSAHWTVVQTNLDGVVIGPNSSTANNVAIFNTTTGKTIADSGIAVEQLVLTNDSRLTDARTPTSHTHGNITNDGKIGAAAHKVVVTGSNGVLTTIGPGVANAALMGNGNSAAPGFVAVSPSSAWTGGTTGGPVLKITVLGVEQSAGATIPSASSSASGVVTTGSQTFKGDKTFQSDTFRIKNANGNNNQAGTNPWVTQLNLGDGNYTTITEYRDDQLAIRGSSILLNTKTIKGAYSSSSTYNIGDYVLYNGYYYRCTTAITTAEEWNSTHWSQMPMSGIMASDNFTPWIDNTYSLGTSGYKWKNIYATTVHATLNGKINNGNTLGSSTKPIYLNNGTPTEASTYAGGTAVTLNGTSKAGSTVSFYAPTGAGTSGQVLKSEGSGAPVWTSIADLGITSISAVIIDWTV